MNLLDRRFYQAYESLSLDGACGSPGGPEYRRVFAQWIASGRPEPIEPFIRERANAGPEAA